MITVLLQVLILGLTPVAAQCPYHMLWLDRSLYKFSDQQLGLQAGLVVGGSNGAGASAGSCTFTNPLLQTKDCVEYTGGLWTVESAREACTGAGLVFGARAVEYLKGFCEGYKSEQFGGVCVSEGGKGTARENVFLSKPLDLLASCAGLATACETFTGGVFDRSGGVCEVEGDRNESRRKRGRGKRLIGAESTDECQVGFV